MSLMNNASSVSITLLNRSCRNGAELNSQYSVYIESYLIKVIKEQNLSESRIEKLMDNLHQKEKEENSEIIFKKSKEFDNKGLSVEEIENWRSIMEYTFESAFIEVISSYNAGKLGRSRDYYERKIYDECISKIK